MVTTLLVLNIAVLTYGLVYGLKTALDRTAKTEERIDVIAACLVDLARGQIKTERDVKVMERWIN